MIRSKQWRGQIARRIAENLDRSPSLSGDETAAEEADPRAADERRFADQLPAWIALACIVAIPVAILVFLLTR